MRHTKGPWHKGQGNGEGSIFADEGRMKWGENGTALYPICSMVTGFGPEDEANADLIAAAPELLDSLLALLPYAHSRAEDMYDEGGHSDPAWQKANAAVDAAYKLVERIKGEKS